LPDLHDLKPGLHGFHLHTFPSCKDQGKAAGKHYDPYLTEQHRGPYKNGHLGDLPVLFVNMYGDATLSRLAPKLTLKDIIGRSRFCRKLYANKN
jgi:superoxide dismutase, Cu-Zn family